MSINKNKDDLLLERIITELGIERENAADLVKYISSVLYANDILSA